MKHRLLATICLLLPAPAAPAAPQFGTNLEGIADWAAVLPFADAIKSARNFGSAEPPWDEKTAPDAAG